MADGGMLPEGAPIWSEPDPIETYIPLPEAQSEAYRQRVAGIWADCLGRWKHG